MNAARSSRRLTSVRLLLLLACCLVLPSCSSSVSEGLGKYPKAVGAADEGSAIQNLRAIANAQTQAKAMRNSYADFVALVQLGFLDERFSGANPNLRGYRFTIVANENQYAITADPQPTQAAPAAGSRHFYLDSTDGVIHVNLNQTATRADPSL
jgi:hypothetical protein